MIFAMATRIESLLQLISLLHKSATVWCDYFFVQAEDGIRDVAVTGVQTCVFRSQLPAALDLVARFPQQPFVIDHLAKPAIKLRNRSGWAALMQKMAAHPNVYCKLSGMVTEADWHHWKRSEEHTSELQSRLHLVCRLLLEKKKKK